MDPIFRTELIEADNVRDVVGFLRAAADRAERLDLLEDWQPQRFNLLTQSNLQLERMFNQQLVAGVLRRMQYDHIKENMIDRLLVGKRLPLPPTFWRAVIAADQGAELVGTSRDGRLLWLLCLPPPVHAGFPADVLMFRALARDFHQRQNVALMQDGGPIALAHL